MVDIKTDAKAVLADNAKVIGALEAGEAKVKVFWADYKFYLVAFVILVVGMIAGYHLHR